MAAKRLPSDKERPVSSDIVEGVAWGLLVAAISAATLYIFVVT
jgi:hypothetical protein